VESSCRVIRTEGPCSVPRCGIALVKFLTQETTPQGQAIGKCGGLAFEEGR